MVSSQLQTFILLVPAMQVRNPPELVWRAVPPLRLISCSGACQPLLPPEPTDSKLSCSPASRLLRPMSESLALHITGRQTAGVNTHADLLRRTTNYRCMNLAHLPPSVSSTFCGFRSRCTMPRSCSAATPRPMSAATW